MGEAAKEVAVTEVKTIVVPEVQVDITEFMAAAENLIEQADRAEITDADSYATGGDLIKIARVQAKKAEELRVKVKKPFLALTKFIDTGFKPVAVQFSLAQSKVSVKMQVWKAAEDKRLREEAQKESARLEAEALERAALEKTEEAQDEVLDVAAEASEKMVENSGLGLQRGGYGSSTGTRKVYSTEIVSQLDFLRTIIAHIDDGNKRNIDLGSIVELRKSGLNTLAKRMREMGVHKMPGAEFKVEDKIAVY